MKRWCCEECGHVHPGENSPMICPDCGAGQDSFIYRRLHKEDYAKIRQLKKRLPDRADIIVLGSGVSAFTAAITAAYYGASVIMMETGDVLGGQVETGFSAREKAAAYQSICQWEAHVGGNQGDRCTYEALANEMIEFLAEEDLLPEFKERKRDPKGAPHPWQQFAESTSLDLVAEERSETRQTLLHQLAHWSTDNGVRMLINHEILEFQVDPEQNVTGVKVSFNDKERVYHADIGLISFLGSTNAELLPEEHVLTDLKKLTIVEKHSKERLQEEEKFWGKDGKIGPSMTQAYQAGMSIVLESGLLGIFLEEAEAMRQEEKIAEAEAAVTTT